MQVTTLTAEKTLVIKASLTWRGGKEPPEEGALICLRGGRVAALAPPRAGKSTPAPASPCPLGGTSCPHPCRAQPSVLELPGCTVLPGLVDCHVHLGLGNGEGLPQILAAYPARGILAVRDGGDAAGLGLAAARRVAGGDLEGPLVVACGRALFKKGGYGSFLGRGLEPAELEEAVGALVREGARQIKVLVSGLVSFKEYGRVGPPQFGPEELRRIVTCARRHGLKVMAHASGEEAVRLAVEAGVDSVEHGYFLTRELLWRMAEKGVAWVPTVIPVAAQLKEGLREKHGPRERGVIARTVSRQLEMIALAREAGVKLGVGTDAGAAGVAHGRSFLEEILLYREAGLSPADVLTAATAGGAEVLGLEHFLGRLAPGRPAYLLAVEGNPWEDLEALGRVKYVIRPVIKESYPGFEGVEGKHQATVWFNEISR
ncbi:metal-dependent hydrolase family protein [Desulfovirgula thermocuniculi]|uniref:metal-dependent hydrolase family protein n=1 Tax=Desulfovirgula thermocuniculi TaxID=348842 RepID=UPI0006861AD5|nr:amidohydrolase family protein [Desulfovirgula thermocuniculi]